ncbi:unnamed protein product, partial [Rotaria magnacalcarata]
MYIFIFFGRYYSICARIVSNAGEEPEAVEQLQEFLTTGPMCRFAKDLTPMYKVLAASNVRLLTLDKK